jgi:hypothetical protein
MNLLASLPPEPSVQPNHAHVSARPPLLDGGYKIPPVKRVA